MHSLLQDAHTILSDAIQSVLPQTAVQQALSNIHLTGRLHVIAVGKAAWTMAKAASDTLGECIDNGIVLTKYLHNQGQIPNFRLLEAGHPVMDENGIRATETILQSVQNLTEEDTILFLLSGGGSSLFEKPAGALCLADIQSVNRQLLACGASIVEINTVRKHLSAVKGGRFAALCAPAKVYTIALSDILGDPVDAIASGPTCPDPSTCADALAIIEKYHISLTPAAMEQLHQETPKELPNAQIQVTGSVSALCQAAAHAAQSLGYTPFVLSTMLDCEAKEAGRFFGSLAQTWQKGESFLPPKCTVICGGETVVHLTGNGKGGRNQELALAAVPYLDGMSNAVLAAVGSDGTDGPTDAAGAIIDGSTAKQLLDAGIFVDTVLSKNDAYHALQQVDALVITGPTGTNVNDLYFLLLDANDTAISKEL